MTFTDYPSRPRRIPTSEDYNNAEAAYIRALKKANS